MLAKHRSSNSLLVERAHRAGKQSKFSGERMRKEDKRQNYTLNSFIHRLVFLRRGFSTEWLICKQQCFRVPTFTYLSFIRLFAPKLMSLSCDLRFSRDICQSHQARDSAGTSHLIIHDQVTRRFLHQRTKVAKTFWAAFVKKPKCERKLITL